MTYTSIQDLSYGILAALLLLDFASILFIYIQKKKNTVKRNAIEKINLIFRHQNIDVEKQLLNLCKDTIYLDAFVEYLSTHKQSIVFNERLLHAKDAICLTYSIDAKYSAALSYFTKTKRINAALLLGYLTTTTGYQALLKRLPIEKNYTVRIAIATALSMYQNPSSLPLLIQELFQTPVWYRDTIILIICTFGIVFFEHLPSIYTRQEKEIGLLIVAFAKSFSHSSIKNYIIACLHSPYPEIVESAATTMQSIYPKTLMQKYYLNSQNLSIRKAAIRSYETLATQTSVDMLITYLSDPEVNRYIEISLSAIIEKNPLLIKSIAEKLFDHQYSSIKKQLSMIASVKIDFYIIKLLTEERMYARKVLVELLKNDISSPFISFLNSNKNIELENEILGCIQVALKEHPKISDPFQRFLHEKILQKLKLNKVNDDTTKRIHVSIVNKIYLLVQLLGLLLLFPLAIYITNIHEINSMPWIEIIKLFIIKGNWALLFYTTIISALYLALLFFASLEARRQKYYSSIYYNSLLLDTNQLPSISIVAPAFNEENSIVDSVNSLLHLKYPCYDLIVVNDGSKDGTLHELINEYNLHRVDYLYTGGIQTKPIIGMYKNPTVPRLTVIDKVNGGKADALNVGINVSGNDYICGIDADCILEQDSLLKITATLLDKDTEPIAAGGNVLPINGCKVNSGFIDHFSIPDNFIAALQTMEYIRAFMAGRLGWSFLNSLLIISGAFGLFSRRRIVEINGYLTHETKYKKDTVGEDMELVVRLIKSMHDQNQHYRITYAYSANCWTEVPQTIKTLYKQRNRWHRGLIEILTFHSTMLFNYRYKHIGLFVLPYFYIFELLGPWIELIGYCMVIASFVLHIVNIPVCILLFCMSVLMGVFISIASLIIIQQQRDYFSAKEIKKLIFLAIIENFGIRQCISIMRVSSYLSLFKGTHTWGSMQRKGFSQEKGREKKR